MRAPKATGRDFRKLARKLANTVQPPRQIERQMWHMVVPQIPFRGLPFASRVNHALGIYLLKRALTRLGFRDRLVWFASPDMAALAGKLDECFSVYYCIDDYASLPGVDSRQIALLDETLAQSVDQVFVSSPALVEDKKKQNPTTAYSPHGVDVELFQQACDPNLPLAEGARNLRRPVIGFYGGIEPWVDLDLLVYLGEARPNWTFLFIGRVEVSLGELAQMPNFIFTGPKPYATLPTWAKAFDVALIPFRQNRLVRNVNPLKLREYLATGKPVVSVPMPEVETLAHCVEIARTHEEFLNKIETALREDNDEKRAARRRVVAGMTWDARVEAILRTIGERFHARR